MSGMKKMIEMTLDINQEKIDLIKQEGDLLVTTILFKKTLQNKYIFKDYETNMALSISTNEKNANKMEKLVVDKEELTDDRRIARL